MFPINYIDIKVPLNMDNVVNDNTNNKNISTMTAVETKNAAPIVKALYNFNAELPTDLTINVCYD